MFRVFLTDLDNTLYDFGGAMEQACLAVIRVIGTGEHKDLIRACIFSPHGVENLQTLVDFLHVRGITNEQIIKAACDEFEDTKNRYIIPFPGVIESMQQIHAAGIRIGAITNASSKFAQERLDLIGINDLIQLLVTPDIIGLKKPDPGAYRLAAEMMGCCPSQICVLGDNLINDIAPAQVVGMFGVHARYGDRLPAEFAGDTRPDATIDTFKEIIDILGLSHQ